MFSWVRLSHIVQWTGAQLSPGQQLKAANFSVFGVSTDSRSVEKGQLFVALKGESFDGHRFIDGAVAKGASAVLTHSPASGCPIPVLVVADPLRALAAIAKGLRSEFKGRVMAVTGSAGKSTTKEMLGVLLGDKTLVSPASFNNLLGVSKSLCLLKDDTRQVVLEMGMNNFGEIAEMCKEFRPDSGLITNIGDAHIGKLGGQEGIFRAKKELFDYLAATPESEVSGIALNLDDPLVERAFNESFKQRTVHRLTYSVEGRMGVKPAEVQVTRSRLNPTDGCLSLHLRCPGWEGEVSVPIFGQHHAQNIAAAVCGALVMGVEAKQLRERLVNVRPAYHRGEVIHLAQNRLLIDESYNSNPTALLSSLETFSRLDKKRRRLLVLGEMKELDRFSEELHRQVGEKMGPWFVGDNLEVIAVGNQCQFLLEGLKSHLPKVSVHLFSDVIAAEKTFLDHFGPGDACLIKGSRGVKLDLLVDKAINAMS